MAVRQIAHRARNHVSARRPRVQVDPSEQQQVVDRFRVALETGDIQGLLDVLAPDVAMVADGGGIASAVRIPLSGADVISRVLGNFQKRGPEGAAVAPFWVNGGPGLRVDIDGVLDTVISLAVEEGRITGIYAVRNPEKLARLEEETRLSRTV